MLAEALSDWVEMCSSARVSQKTRPGSHREPSSRANRGHIAPGLRRRVGEVTTVSPGRIRGGRDLNPRPPPLHHLYRRNHPIEAHVFFGVIQCETPSPDSPSPRPPGSAPPLNRFGPRRQQWRPQSAQAEPPPLRTPPPPPWPRPTPDSVWPPAAAVEAAECPG